jgi:signal recognition particle subunit SEC65
VLAFFYEFGVWQPVSCLQEESPAYGRRVARKAVSAFAEDALKDEIDILQMKAEVKELLEFGIA